MKKILSHWRAIVESIIVLVAIFFMFAVAPFGFLFAAQYDIQLIRVITIFLSVILILYLLKKHERKN